MEFKNYIHLLLTKVSKKENTRKTRKLGGKATITKKVKEKPTSLL